MFKKKRKVPLLIIKVTCTIMWGGVARLACSEGRVAYISLKLSLV